MTADQLLQKAQAAHQSGRAAEAEDLCRKAVAASAGHVMARRFLAMLLVNRGELTEAERHIAHAVQLAPGDPSTRQNHAMLLAGLARLDEAIAAASAAIALKPDFSPAYVLRGQILTQTRRFAEAITDYNKAKSLGRFGDPALFFGLGYALAETGDRAQALEAYARAIKLKPDFAQALLNRGCILMQAGQSHDALAHFDRALQIDPNNPEIHRQRGNVFTELGRTGEAIAAYDRALALDPHYAGNWYNLAITLAGSGDYDKALNAYDRAAALEQDFPLLRSMRQHAAMHLCDWRDFDAHCKALFADVERGAPVQPYALMCLPSSPQLQRRAAETLAARHPPQPPLHSTVPRKDGRLRVAYVSAMFRNHPTSLLLADVLTNHDRQACEIFGISHGIDDQSPVRARMTEVFEHFIDVQGQPDRAIAERMAALDLDVAIELDGFTEGARPGILAHRPARVQVQFLGFPGTMGAAHIDYLIGDAIVSPPEMAALFREAVIRMPHSYQPNSARPAAPIPSRAAAGLPENTFVFGCFNNHFKITPQIFDVWAKILARVPESVLWLLVDNETARNNLRNEATARGINPARLIFAPRASVADHMARQALIDVFLDTFFYNAHTTASDALWMGVPVVTMLGEAFPARVAASLVTAAGLPELVTHTPEEYETLAVSLAGDPARLAALKARLAVRNSPLFDSAGFARALESAFVRIAERHQRAEPAQDLAVQA